jgi:hypothetical protein
MRIPKFGRILNRLVRVTWVKDEDGHTIEEVGSTSIAAAIVKESY